VVGSLGNPTDTAHRRGDFRAFLEIASDGDGCHHGALTQLGETVELADRFARTIHGDCDILMSGPCAVADGEEQVEIRSRLPLLRCPGELARGRVKCGALGQVAGEILKWRAFGVRACEGEAHGLTGAGAEVADWLERRRLVRVAHRYHELL